MNLWLLGTLIAVGLTYFHSGQAAEPAINQQAEREARSFLPPCHEVTDQRQQLCLQHQSNFIEMYVYALRGDLDGISSTAFSFDAAHSATDPLDAIGLPSDIMQACAWRLLRIHFGPRGTVDDHINLARRLCGQLSEADFQAAELRTARLIVQIHDHPTAEPGDQWEPNVPGLKRPPPYKGPLRVIDP